MHLEGLNLNPWFSLILEILNREVAKIRVAKSFFLQEDWCFFCGKWYFIKPRRCKPRRLFFQRRNLGQRINDLAVTCHFFRGNSNVVKRLQAPAENLQSHQVYSHS